jgi:hypothetical protein
MQLTMSDMFFEDSYERNLEATKADAASWAVGIVIVLLSIIVLVSSFASWKYKKLVEKR